MKLLIRAVSLAAAQLPPGKRAQYPERSKNMIDFKNSKLFTPYTHPVTGVTCYLLTHKVAPVQEAFYFTNENMSADGRYLWFYCAFPPSGSGGQGRTLGVVDLATQEVRHFPDTQFNEASPMVDPATGEAIWGMGTGLWRRGPGVSDPVIPINSLPPDIIGSRPVPRIATHLTRSADGRTYFVDAHIGLQYVFGTLPVNGDPFEEWYRFERNYNHAQISPTDPDVVLFAQEHHGDPITGLNFPITNRLWLMRRGEKPRPILREPLWVTHEWWDPDGAHVWCVWGNETWRVETRSGDVEKILFPHHCWHSHSSQQGEYIIGDSNVKFYRGCPSSVHFLNRKTGRLVKIIDNPAMEDYVGGHYHIDPHPRFSCGDQVGVFTTTVRGAVDLAVVPVQDLIERTS